MKNNDSKSLEEVWEMKDEVKKEFEESKFEYFSEFINSSVSDIKVKYNLNIKYHKDKSKHKTH